MIKTGCESDKKEGVFISKNWVALIALIMILLTSMVSVVAYSVGVSKTADVAYQSAIQNTEQIQINKEIITQNKEDIAVTKSQYNEIIRRLDNIEKKVDKQ